MLPQKKNPVTCGVPQGSILGPLLFILYLNDITDHVSHCRIIKYADDTVLYYSGKNIDIIESYLSKDFDLISEWCTENELLLNLKKNKTEAMLFGTSQKLSRLQKTLTISYKYNNINVVTTYKYLGIKIDCSLKLNSHFEKSYKRASGKLNLLSKIRYQIDSKTAETIYRSMILPVFNYCCLLLMKQSNTLTSRCKAFEVRACKIIRNGGENVKIDVPTLEGFKKRQACEFVRRCLVQLLRKL